MRRLIGVVLVAFFAVVLGLAGPAAATHTPTHGCPKDSVRVGTTCVDTYEASVWEVPPIHATTGLINKIRKGTVTLADLTSPEAVAAGVVQRGATSDNYDVGLGCPVTGNGCVNLYAVSIPGVTPSGFITYFQAVAAARNARKRLPTNAEWQAAALGTPDGAPCNVSSGSVAVTGTAGCVSDVGAFDMVGNLYEWVADWVPMSTACVTPLFGTGDDNCLAGASTTSAPGALLRGGLFFGGTHAGVFSVNVDGPTGGFLYFGFCAAR
jgi:hypothetical protein